MADPREKRIRLTTLYRKRSKSGTEYLTGVNGTLRITIHSDKDVDDNGEPTLGLYIEPRLKKPGSNA